MNTMHNITLDESANSVSVLARGFWWACGCRGQIASALRVSRDLKGPFLREPQQRRVFEKGRVLGIGGGTS